MKHKLSIAVIIIVALLLSKDMILPVGFPSTHDGENHLARFANYYQALKEGQFPPRFAPYLEAGLGYPVLNFNYPLANILALPFIIANVPVELTLKTLCITSLIMAGLGMFFFLRIRYTPLGSLLGSLAYLSAPYQLANIYIRGNIGESTALAVLPWVLYLAIKAVHKPKIVTWYIFFLAMLLLSHNLIAILSIPVIFILLLTTLNRQQLKQLTLPTLCSVLLVSFFWLPALWEKRFIVLDQSPLSLNNLMHHFVSLRQLFSSVWDHGYSYSFPVDGLPVGLGLVGIISALAALPVMIRIKEKKQKIFAAVTFGGFLICLFLMLPISAVIWQLVPYASIIQFPWRLLFFTTFFGSLLTAFIADYWSEWVICLTLSLSLLSSLSGPLGINYFHKTDADWFSFPLNTTIADENDPIWYQRTQAFEFLGQHPYGPILKNASGSAAIERWDGSNRKYSVTANQAASIIEPTLYFPGWITTIDGQEIDLRNTVGRHFGLINFDLPAGTHEIVSRFTQRTPARIIGNSLSLAGLVWFIIICKKRHAKKV